MNASDSLTNRNPLILVVSGALWLVSVALAGVSIFALHALLVWGMALLIPQPDTRSRLQAADLINLTQQCGLILFGVLGLMVIVFSCNTFFRYMGQPRSVRTLAWVIAGECAIVAPVWWLLWR